ncbi:Uu.00g026710.m01.CDS01 [Anthostomella pinea]|uniref:Uu.00g026710.m01.CDS01 n=1 Tax=Anthostomella pinea TaxID=933095 RepID=A0AAI8YCR9_9PEZI|nr:Uu.00g026710.m01.CDS01 [Anthostomella pinea]
MFAALSSPLSVLVSYLHVGSKVPPQDLSSSLNVRKGMANTTNKLTCGFCGFISPQSGLGARAWTPYYRGVYCTGPGDDDPYLSGVGYHRHDSAENFVPPEAHQRFDDAGLDPLSLIAIRDINPPAPEISDAEKATYSWGFLFHDACWQLLEQASAPHKVDVKALWRILLSVPCASDLPNWGHNYGGLYLGVTNDSVRGEHFVLLGATSHLIIPSTFSDPFKVPELSDILARLRIDTEDTTAKQSEQRSVISLHDNPSTYDPFSALPFEIKEMLLTYVASKDAANLRLASREIAALGLSQYFFQSRFWPSHELGSVFDGFLLSPSERIGLGWKALFLEMKTRLKYNRVCLGERNRFRIWNQTLRPLVNAMDNIRALSELKGGQEWKSEVGSSEGLDWPSVKTSRNIDPEAYGEIRRREFRAEVVVPPIEVEAVHVSFAEFFGGRRYITGLRFSFGKDSDVEVGYISRALEETLHVEGGLKGFHSAVDECGFRALALHMGQHMTSEYLHWAGSPGTLSQVPARTSSAVGRIRASFDAFRMQSISILES